MIRSLHIQNLATIEKIDLPLLEGFTILTGETGAGKSIIIDGLRLVLGEKGSPDMIRTGKKETSVEVIFPFHQKMTDFKDYFTEKDEDMLVQRRVASRGGRKSVRKRYPCSQQKTQRNGRKTCRYLRSERSCVSP